MGFMEAYKRLDNLCKDLFESETGVTPYINNLEYILNTGSQPINAYSDYKQLKHYRYIRNQIVHENNANETNMCDKNDTLWIEQFHQRILNQTDPISLYQKAIAGTQRHASKSKRKAKPAQSQVVKKRTSKSKKAFTIIMIALILVSVILLWLLHQSL